MARLQYGWGLRISELCSLRVKDVDLDRGKRIVRAGKGDKDRSIPLPRSMLEDLRAHLAEVRAIHENDRAEQRPGGDLPEAPSRKMPRAG
jgi:integrase